MFHGEVEEKVIAETSCHRSLKSLRSYEHTSQQQQQNVSSMINTTVEKEQEREKKSVGLLNTKQEVINDDIKPAIPSQAL